MTLEDLEKKLTELDDLRSELNKLDDLRMELNKHIAELKAQREEKPEPPHPRPYPEDYQNYYYINPMGEVEQTKWTSERFELRVHEIGNVFRAKADAEFAAERLKVLAEMRNWGGKWNDSIFLLYNSVDDSIETTMRSDDYINGEICFATPKDAHNCVEAVGAGRIKKYYFMIPEETNND